MSMMRRWTVACALLLSIGVPMVWGEQDTTQQPKGPDRVDELMGRYNLHPAFEKLGRGASNALLGWLEIPTSIQQRYSKSDTASSTLTGLAYGLFKGAVRTAVGAYEAATFFLPYPENFAPILPTQDYFNRTTKRKPLPLEY